MMLNRVSKIINRLSKPHNKNRYSVDELNFLYQIPFQLPKKRWPEFLFKTYNEKVAAARAIFRDFDAISFFNVNKQLTLFQHGETSFGTKIIVQFIQIEQKEISQLRINFEQFKSSHRAHNLRPFLISIHTYIQSLENMLINNRHHHKTTLYLNEGIRNYLQEVEANLTKIFHSLDDVSIKMLPQKLAHCDQMLSSVASEIPYFTEYHRWYSKLSSTILLLQTLASSDTDLTDTEIKKSLRPWFSGFVESELFLEQCIRQILTHFIVPTIKTPTDKRLTLIRAFYPVWADGICDRLQKNSLLSHLEVNNKRREVGRKNQTTVNPSFFSSVCFWLKLNHNSSSLLNHDLQSIPLANEDKPTPPFKFGYPA